VVFFGPGDRRRGGHQLRPGGCFRSRTVGGFVVCFIAQFFAVALAACATDALEGHDTTFGQGPRRPRAAPG
jgi:hypothetical protein